MKAEMTDQAVDQAVLAEIRHARERVAYFVQWKHEPSCKKKLGHWRRRLKKALAVATERKLAVPADPYAPPPPPPTEEELRAAALKEAQGRVRFEWQVMVGQHYWAPWGNSGWSAIILTKLSRVWCRASRVDPRTSDVTTHTGKVRRDRLVKRDPALKGKDRPVGSPEEIVPQTVPAEPEPETASTLAPKPEVERSQAEQAKIDADVAKLLGLLDDESTADDW